MTARLTPGSTAPEFSLPDSDGNPVSLRDYAGQSVVLYFYPAAMTPGCTTQAVDFSAALDAFPAAGHQVIGVSPDPVERLATFKEKSGGKPAHALGAIAGTPVGRALRDANARGAVLAGCSAGARSA